jgi:dienelactone hydrolase
MDGFRRTRADGSVAEQQRVKPAGFAFHTLLASCLATILATACNALCSPSWSCATARWYAIPEAAAADPLQPSVDPQLDTLADISLDALRARRYGSTVRPELDLSESAAGAAYREHFSQDGSAPYHSYIASYVSDGNRVYTRIDVPARGAPPGGYPVLIFVHGWYGREAAPAFDFMYTPDSLYSRYIDAFVDAGFLVLSPALRGHGTVNGVPAEGIGFLDAWDNASYLSPVFYAIDALNLLEGLRSLEAIDWSQWGQQNPVRVDTSRIGIAGQSQGGDVALTALAVSGEGSMIRNALAAGSVWSGCFGPRLEQLAIYGPMSATLEAFMSGDGSWTGTATGADGRVNPNFVFGWPPDWIGTVDTRSPEWTWQAETWSTQTVAQVLQDRTAEMYRAINAGVGDIDDAAFELATAADGRVSVRHDPRIVSAMRAIDAFNREELLREPLHLHHSDQDYYSIPRWNIGLAKRINSAGGHARDYLYPRNTHSLLASPHRWFSPRETVAGLPYMIRRDLMLFAGTEATEITAQADELLSIEALRDYAAALKNEFKPEFEREPLNRVSRRVVSFTADDLKQYALVLEPTDPPPNAGWPVLLMNHGHHPNPPEYSRIADGSTDRPGDYYRSVPQAFAEHGFLVVVPDFRGHNDSEGGEYAHGLLESYWYSRDTIAAFRALDSLPRADTSRIFMWGHSMGGNVTLRALLALGDEVRGASIWSASAAGLWERAAHHASRTQGQAADSDRLEALRAEIDALPFGFDPERADPTAFLDQLQTPLIIQHATGDPVVPFHWSADIANELAKFGQPVTLHSYPSANHLFEGAELKLAIERDVAFFRQQTR